MEIILEAAARILERRGLEGFNTNVIAQQAGVSVGSLYQYFPNKEAIAAALIERTNAVRREAVASAVDAAIGMTLEESIGLAVRMAMAAQMARPGLDSALDYLEARLPLGTTAVSVERGLVAEIVRLAQRHARQIVETDLERAAQDTILIARTLIDAALARGESDSAAIEARIVRATMGYLTGGKAAPGPARGGNRTRT